MLLLACVCSGGFYWKTHKVLDGVAENQVLSKATVLIAVLFSTWCVFCICNFAQLAGASVPIAVEMVSSAPPPSTHAYPPFVFLSGVQTVSWCLHQVGGLAISLQASFNFFALLKTPVIRDWFLETLKIRGAAVSKKRTRKIHLSQQSQSSQQTYGGSKAPSIGPSVVVTS